MEKPIFILGCHKSGTSLLRSLLDGHKDLFVFPVESHFFQYNNFWVDYPLRKARPTPPFERDLLSAIKSFANDHNGNNSPYSDNPNFKGVNISLAENYLNSKNVPTNLVEYFVLYHRALYYSISSGVMPNFRFVEKTVENAEFVPILKSFFPSAKFVHIVRNPYKNYLSIVKSKNKNGYPSVSSIIKSMENSYCNLFKNKELIDDYLTIKYEDLVSNPLEVMESLSINLELEFFDTLLSPTSQGEQWTGNSTTNEQLKGVSESVSKLKKDDLKPFEVEVVNKIAEPILNAFHYEKIELNESKWVKIRNESIKIYIRNRMFLGTI